MLKLQFVLDLSYFHLLEWFLYLAMDWLKKNKSLNTRGFCSSTHYLGDLDYSWQND